MKSKIKALASKYEQQIIAFRNHFHQNPELSFQEHETMAFVEEQLHKHGITNTRRIVNTGLLVEINGTKPGRTIALRADMDALPICEDEKNPVCSLKKGIMHACGHDMHTASLIGTAMLLHDIRKELKGRVLLIFQPGEEYMPSGAKMIIESGVLDAYDIDWIVGQHTDPELETGKIGFKQGAYMASTDELFLTIKGKGGHSAFPHLLTDTVLAASQTVVAMQQIVSRRKNPVTPPCVLSFGRFIADGATNIIPEKVELAGTLRCMDENWRAEAKELLTNIATHTARAYGTECNVHINHGYPAVFNHEKLTQFAHNTAMDFLNPQRVVTLPLRMGGEDFGFYTQRYPATFYRFGVKPCDKSITGLHTPRFFGDEKALITSMSTMAWIGYSFLDQN